MLYGKIKDSCSHPSPLQVTREEIAAFEIQTDFFNLGERMVRAGIRTVDEGKGMVARPTRETRIDADARWRA
jgi:hypothetical protein